MTTLNVIMSNDCRPYVTAKPCIPFSRNIVQVARAGSVSRIEVWTNNDSDRKLWEESWVIMRNGQDIAVVYRDVKGSSPFSNELGEVLARYTLRDDALDNVAVFIASHSHLIQSLKDVTGVIQDFFDSKNKPSLELWVDQEYPETRQLVIRIPSELSGEAAIQKLNVFRREYWLSQPYEVRRDMAVRY